MRDRVGVRERVGERDGGETWRREMEERDGEREGEREIRGERGRER